MSGVRSDSSVVCNRVFIRCCRSLPKLASHDDEDGLHNGQYLGVGTFEPIPHDHDFCERVVINVSESSRQSKAKVKLFFSSHFSGERIAL